MYILTFTHPHAPTKIASTAHACTPTTSYEVSTHANSKHHTHTQENTCVCTQTQRHMYARKHTRTLAHIHTHTQTRVPCTECGVSAPLGQCTVAKIFQCRGHSTGVLLSRGSKQQQPPREAHTAWSLNRVGCISTTAHTAVVVVSGTLSIGDAERM